MTALPLLFAVTMAASPPVTTDIQVSGNKRTRTATVLDLLPRQPPTIYTDDELVELERRVDNLSIFDSVHVERKGPIVEVVVREKWTLVPNFDFSSGRTFADTYAMLGLTEYNFLGRADQLGGDVYHADRGFGVDVYYWEQTVRRSRWTLGLDVSAGEAEYRFDDGTGWKVTSEQAVVQFTSPPLWGDHLNMRLGGTFAHEGISNATGEAPPDSESLRSFVGFTYNRYRWRDLVASGYKVDAEFGTGALVGPTPAQPRHSAQASFYVAIPLAKYTVLMGRINGGVLTRGNPDFSFLVGSLRGVRGLEDALYRNWAQAFTNVELRQAIKLSERWALQGVLFTDAAVFEQMNSNGTDGSSGQALSVGVGARIIPTWLASIVGRIDLARLLTPDHLWFVQYGLSQYF